LQAGAGFEFVIGSAVGGLALLDGALRDDAGKGEFAIAEKKEVAFMTKKRH